MQRVASSWPTPNIIRNHRSTLSRESSLRETSEDGWGTKQRGESNAITAMQKTETKKRETKQIYREILEEAMSACRAAPPRAVLASPAAVS